ncbi:unnamed protein product [Staurois parvus]|uniref:Uncharacterized protein n=1 Tax=Staurois parvus TaxID=386267 RepID=A0ABN9FAC9_9NEOB|nr:unnamed protein product [Staurois parvus]
MVGMDLEQTGTRSRAPEYTCLRWRNPPGVYAGGKPDVKRQRAEAGMAGSVLDGWMSVMDG